ncbi:hypothetical protein JCM19376_39140 [Fusibacter bizertensis]
MFQIGYILVVFGFLYGLYSYYCKHRINIYLKFSIEKILNEKEYFKIQFLISILNSLFLVLAGLLIQLLHLGSIYIFATIMIFHTNHSVILFVSYNKKYIERS